MKRISCVILLLIMAIFLVNPSPSLARGGHGGGHWGWWAPWAIIGGAALVAPYYYYGRYYYDPYYYPPAAPPVVVQEPPPVYVQPAPAAPSAVPPAAEKMFIYPRQGQDEQQQATDRYECHRWATGQTGYDPTKPSDGLTGAQQAQMRSDYQRAMGACLDGRGYTMR